MPSDKIRLLEIVLYGYHGVGEAERELGGKYAIDLELTTDTRRPGMSDDLADAVDYQAVYETVREVEASRQFRLLEALAESLAAAILARFAVESVTLRVRKLSVPVGGLLDCAEVEITRTAAD